MSAHTVKASSASGVPVDCARPGSEARGQFPEGQATLTLRVEQLDRRVDDATAGESSLRRFSVRLVFTTMRDLEAPGTPFQDGEWNIVPQSSGVSVRKGFACLPSFGALTWSSPEV